LTNIFVCNSCNGVILAEERSAHTCKKVVKDLKIDQDKLLVSDGENWYPLNLKKVSKSFLLKILFVPIVNTLIFVPQIIQNQKT
jgi:hypothetical protein